MLSVILGAAVYLKTCRKGKGKRSKGASLLESLKGGQLDSGHTLLVFRENAAFCLEGPA